MPETITRAEKGEPPKVAGATYFVTIRVPIRWKPYKPTSQEVRLGKMGRWQKMNEYGGWDNFHFGPDWEWGEYNHA